MTLEEFLLARIAEDEADAQGPAEAIHFPAERLLAECEAKRRIMEEHYFMAGYESLDISFSNGNCLTCRVQGPCPTLRLLALPYVDHPDFDESWRV